jgi:hypothetical protein
MRGHKEFGNDKDGEIKFLKQELALARADVVGLSRKKFFVSMYGFRSCKTTEEYNHWRNELVWEIIQQQDEITDEDSHGKTVEYSGRARCPLCGKKPLKEIGFTIPNSLKRHLEGSGGKKTKCTVMDNLFGLAESNYWDA